MDFLHWTMNIRYKNIDRKTISTPKSDTILLNCNLQMEQRFMRRARDLILSLSLTRSLCRILSAERKNAMQIKIH